MNASLNSQFDKIRQYERFQDELRDPHAAKMLSLDSKQMIRNVEQDVQALKYKLKRLVSQQEDAHIILQAGHKLEDFCVVPETYMYFKCHVGNQPPPGNLTVHYAPGQFVRNMDMRRSLKMSTTGKRQVDLKIIYSNSNVREPTEKDCNKQYLNPQGKIKLSAPPGRDTFEHDFLYFTLFSHSGCTISLHMSFQDDDRTAVKREKKPAIDFSLVNEDDLEVIKHYNKLKDAVEAHKIDFVERNKEELLHAHPVTKL